MFYLLYVTNNVFYNEIIKFIVIKESAMNRMRIKIKWMNIFLITFRTLLPGPIIDLQSKYYFCHDHGTYTRW